MTQCLTTGHPLAWLELVTDIVLFLSVMILRISTRKMNRYASVNWNE